MLRRCSYAASAALSPSGADAAATDNAPAAAPGPPPGAANFPAGTSTAVVMVVLGRLTAARRSHAVPAAGAAVVRGFAFPAGF